MKFISKETYELAIVMYVPYMFGMFWFALISPYTFFVQRLVMIKFKYRRGYLDFKSTETVIFTFSLFSLLVWLWLSSEYSYLLKSSELHRAKYALFAFLVPIIIWPVLFFIQLLIAALIRVAFAKGRDAT